MPALCVPPNDLLPLLSTSLWAELLSLATQYPHYSCPAVKPLSQEDHSAQFYRVDPLMQAMTRTMGAQNMRPESLDRRDALQRQLALLRRQVAAEVNKALEVGKARASPGRQAGAATANSGRGGGGSGGFLGQLWRQPALPGGGGVAVPPPGGGGGEGREQGLSLEGLRSGQHEGLRLALDEVNALVKQYNSAVLQVCWCTSM
jgi:hypothetical protein